MKKFGLAVCFTLIFIIIYLLQSNFFSWFTIAGVKPNLIIIFVYTLRYLQYIFLTDNYNKKDNMTQFDI